MSSDNDIGQRLEGVIYESGNRPTTLSIELGFSRAQISALIKSGNIKRNPKLQLICDRIGANKDYILYGTLPKFLKDEIIAEPAPVYGGNDLEARIRKLENDMSIIKELLLNRVSGDTRDTKGGKRAG